MLERARIAFVGKDGGELVFAAVEADLDIRYGSAMAQLARNSLGKAPTTIRMPVDAVGQ